MLVEGCDLGTNTSNLSCPKSLGETDSAGNFLYLEDMGADRAL
jgi:hypothetical protein